MKTPADCLQGGGCSRLQGQGLSQVLSITRIAASMLSLIALNAYAGAFIQKSIVDFRIPEQGYIVAPYISEGGEWLHFQPRDVGDELLVNARTGNTDASNSNHIRDGRRLGSISPDEVGSAPNSHRLAYLYSLGCSQHNRGCTVMDDDPRLVFTSFHRSTNRFVVEIVDLNPLLAEFLKIVSGKVKQNNINLDAVDQSVLEYAIRFTPYREQVIDGIRSIRGLQDLERFQQARRTANLCSWNVFTCADKSSATIDLRREEEQIMVKIYAHALGKKYLEHSQQKEGNILAEFLQKITSPPFPVETSTHAIDEFMQFSPAERETIAKGLIAITPSNDTLRCFSAWIRGNNCNEIRKPAVSANTSNTEIRTNRRTQEPEITSQNTASTGIPEEWQRISAQPDKMKLISIDEASGVLVRDSASIGGVVFVARATGDISDGKFEIVAKPNSISPVLLQYGSYRVKLELGLNYVREDSCVGVIHCLLGNNQRIAKTVTRTITFTLQPGNKWSETKTAYFGHLLPLTADGASLYRSSLRDLRLAAKGINWTLD